MSAIPDNDKKAATRIFEDATPLLAQPDALRERAEKDGYLFFKGLLDKDELRQVRYQMLDVMQQWGLLDSRHAIDEGIGDYEAVNKLTLESFRGYGVPWELYKQIQRLEAFHQLAHQPALLQAYRILFGSEVLPHPRNIARIVMPHRELKATPSHQDFIHIQGTPETWTAWFPLGDCPRELGGLAMLEGSYKSGVLGVTNHGGAGGLESVLCSMDLEWAEGDYELGDVIIFHSHTVHKALPNRQGNQIRLSCDFRYQPLHLPVDRSSLQPHGGEAALPWEEVYEGWVNEKLQYYWTELPLVLSDWDENVRWQKEKIC